MTDGWDANPFGQALPSRSPFNDPAVLSVTSAPSASADFNAFGSDSTSFGAATITRQASANASNAAQQQPARPASASSANAQGKQPQQGPSAIERELAAKEAALRAKEEELARRQMALDEREIEIANRPAATVIYKEPPPNWPPFPKWCFFPFKSFYYHDIDAEILPQYKRLCRWLYYAWLATCLCWISNFVGSFAVLVGCSECSGDLGPSFGLALVYMFLFIPLSFICWYRVIYNGFKKDSTLSFFWFFFAFSFQILADVVNTIGIPSSGSAGYIVAISALTKNVAVGVVCIIASCIWTANTVFSIFLIKKVHEAYKTGGKSWTQAQSEAIGTVAGSRVVQEGIKSSILRNQHENDDDELFAG
eukprot:Opistho-2@42878